MAGAIERLAFFHSFLGNLMGGMDKGFISSNPVGVEYSQPTQK